MKDIHELLTEKITWKRTGLSRWSAKVGGEDCQLRLNNFPDEPLYTLLWRDKSLDVEDAPPAWTFGRRPSPPKAGL